jgi:hypothetical protein
MNSVDKSSFPRRMLQESRPVGSQPEKKKFSRVKLPRFFKSKAAKAEQSETTENFQRKPFFNSRKKVILTVIISVIVVTGGSVLGWYAWYQYQLSQNPAVIYAKKLKSITDIASQQVSLPRDEQPVVATVSDSTKLPKQAFFQEAQNGDKILMYKKHKQAILYRPTTGKVLTEATLDFVSAKPTPQPQQAVAGASTSAVIIGVTPEAPSVTSAQYIPHGKILIQPQQ